MQFESKAPITEIEAMDLCVYVCIVYVITGIVRIEMMSSRELKSLGAGGWRFKNIR
jgi:hypothetical protein